jgi:hypothetical protein
MFGGKSAHLVERLFDGGQGRIVKGCGGNIDVNYGIPRVEVEGLPIPGRIRFGAPRGETSPGVFAQNTYSFRDTLSWVRGAQAWKFGAEITREQNNNNLLGGARPGYSFVGLFNLANDAPNQPGLWPEWLEGQQGGREGRTLRAGSQQLRAAPRFRLHPEDVSR